MSAASGLKAVWLAWFSQPAGNRLLYRQIRKRRPRKILELGIGDGARALEMLSLARRYHGANEISYVGIDRFETRPADQPHLSLKDAHRLLRGSGVRITLIPGDAHQALARSANALCDFELVLISSEQDPASLAPAWFYLPRTLAKGAIILREQVADGQPTFEQFTRRDVDGWAATSAPRRRAA